MAVRNMMENIVSSLIEGVLEKNEEFEPIKKNYSDILAYVLNRVPPKYVTSERGILHTEIDSKFMFQQKSDIMFYIYEAIEVIKNRRDNSPAVNAANMPQHKLFFPHLIGEVLEETTFSIIPGVKVTLLQNGQKAEMIDENWINPYTTNTATKGYFHFWPVFDENSDIMDNVASFEIKFDHPKMEPKTIEIKLPVEAGYDIKKSYKIPIAFLSLKEGESL